MPDHLTFYLPGPVRLDELGVQAAGAPARLTIGSASIVLNVMPDAKLRAHLDGLAQFLRYACGSDEAVIERFRAMKSCVATIVEPARDASVDAWARQIASSTGALVFDGQAFRDGMGRTIAEPDRRAAAQDDEPQDDDDESEEPLPPTVQQVRDRAIGLLSAACRGFAESLAPDAARAELSTLRAWLGGHGLADALTPRERSAMAADVGELPTRVTFDMTWRIEGALVLAWALQLVEMLPPDELIAVNVLAPPLGMFASSPPRESGLQLREPDELDWQHRRLLGLHWRMRDFRLNGTRVNLRELAAGRIWFGGFDLAGIDLIENDLAIDGRPIDEADPSAVARTASAARERHRAIEWLRDCRPCYDDVDTST